MKLLWIAVALAPWLGSCGRAPTATVLTGPTDITVGMDARKAVGILLGGGARPTELAIKVSKEDPEEIQPYDLPDGTLLILRRTKADGRIAGMVYCETPVSKADSIWTGVPKFTVEPSRAILRRWRLESGMLSTEAFEYLREQGAVKTGESTDKSIPPRVIIWHEFKLADGRDLKFSGEEGNLRVWDFQTRSAGKEWFAPMTVWLKPKPPKGWTPD